MTTRSYRPPSGASPCGKCPFRRASLSGWLGSATPESFIAEILMERPLPCHPTIDYGDPAWLDRWSRQETGKICAGSLIMSANMCKIPRDPGFPRLPRDADTVFGTHLEFLKHHGDAPARSDAGRRDRAKSGDDRRHDDGRGAGAKKATRRGGEP